VKTATVGFIQTLLNLAVAINRLTIKTTCRELDAVTILTPESGWRDKECTSPKRRQDSPFSSI